MSFQALDADTGDLLYSFLPDGDNYNLFTIETLSGLIRTAQSFEGLTGSMFELTVIVKDNGGRGVFNTDNATVQVYVYCYFS